MDPRTAALERITQLANVDRLNLLELDYSLCDSWEEVQRSAQQSIERLWRACALETTVDTVLDGRLIARTEIRIGGSEVNSFSANLPSSIAKQHSSRARAEARRRIQILAVLAAATQTLIAISAAAANPLLIFGAIRNAQSLCQELNRF